LKRDYKIYNGNCEGTHYIYDNKEELLKDYLDIKIWEWRDNNLDSYEIGDWIKTDDGFYVQILKTRKLYNKEKRNINTFIRFPMGTFCVYRRKDSGFTYPKLLSFISKLDSSSISGSYRNLDRDVMQKIKFATYILTGVEPHKAYILAYKPITSLTSYQCKRKAVKLMNDKIVRNEISNQLQTFVTQVDDTFSIERLVTELDRLLTLSKAGTKDHRENIEFIMELKGIRKRQNSKPGKIEEISYEEIPANMKD